jgi:alkylation response protein AidB-like acyl-CoA dehydrogenase
MSNFQPNTEDMRQILQILDATQQLQTLPAFAEVDTALMQQVLEEAGRFVASEIAPLQRVGDEVGARFEAGQVTMPPGFRAAYQAFWQAGWPALACAPEDGGQGLPAVLEALLYEMLSAANHGWTMAPGLLHGAYECLKHHGSEALKTRYLEKIATGEWLATMCLTEPQAGSDLGLVRTKATPQADGSHLVSGGKIFISGGEHDLSDNIVHFVLARLPDAPPGPKGLSLFLAPKFLSDGSRNGVFCERIEEKMGLHGSPTCVLRFEDATGWLVGEPHRGLGAMFVMMNAARLHVGLQGIALLEAAWQKAHAYARERRQMRAPGATQTSLIQDHPAIQRILSTQRAWIDGGRLLAYKTAIELDMLKHHPEAARRASAQRWCSLVTPVLKAAWTNQGFVGASACLQVFGGHGYVREWGIEQIVRDARVTMIYEGTNEIQAIDLLLRKVLPDGGAALSALFDELAADGPLPAGLAQRFTQLRQLAARLALAAGYRNDLPYWVADDFLQAVALALLDWAGTRIAAQSPQWQAPARALHTWVLPAFALHLQIIEQQLTDTETAAPTPAAA